MNIEYTLEDFKDQLRTFQELFACEYCGHSESEHDLIDPKTGWPAITCGGFVKPVGWDNEKEDPSQ